MCLKAVKLVYCRHRNLKCYEWGFWQWKVKRLCFEYDTDPYYQALDVKVKDYASSTGVEVFSPVSHTLFNPAHIIEKVSGSVNRVSLDVSFMEL